MTDNDSTKKIGKEHLAIASILLIALGIAVFYAYGVVTLQNESRNELFVDLVVDHENQSLWVIHSAGEKEPYDHVSVTVTENTSGEDLVVFRLSSDSSYGVVSSQGVSLSDSDMQGNTVIQNGSVPSGSNVTVTVHKVYTNGSRELLKKEGFRLY